LPLAGSLNSVYATNYTYVITYVAYKMHNTALLTVEPFIRPVEKPHWREIIASLSSY